MAGDQAQETRIAVDPLICSGKPHIRGTRIMVKNILGMVAGGYNIMRAVTFSWARAGAPGPPEATTSLVGRVHSHTRTPCRLAAVRRGPSLHPSTSFRRCASSR